MRKILPQIKYVGQIVPKFFNPDNWKSIKPCDVLLVCHDNDRGYIYQGQAYSPLLDSLGDLFRQKDLRILTVAKPLSKLTQQSAYGEPVNFSTSFSRSFVLMKLQSRIFRIFFGESKRYLHWAQKQIEEFWIRTLNLAHPKVIIAIMPSPQLCQACHFLSIPIYDLQHGVISEQHPCYGKKFMESINKLELPSGFLCWDENSAKVIKEWAGQKKISVRVVGNVWFQRFLTNNPKDKLVQEALDIERHLNTKKPTILISLQWGMKETCGKYVNNGVIPDALERTILKLNDTYNWLIRLHPVQIRGDEFAMVDNYLTKTFGHLNTLEWNQCSEMPLPIVLKWSDLHLTYNSSITIEAAWMGVPTGLLSPEIRPGGKEDTCYIDERNLKIAETLPLDHKAIENWIKSALKKGKFRSTLAENQNNLDLFISHIVTISKEKNQEIKG